MTIVDSIEIINNIINGKYEDDNPTRIVKYENARGSTTFGVTFKGDDINHYMHPTEFVKNPVIYWEPSTIG